jgi:sulfur-carrier protein adenylyltransferase/sulfurtransferase
MSRTDLYLQGAANPAGFRDVTPQQLASTTVRPRLVDVREPHEFTGELGHVEGAELVPMNSAVEASKTWDRDVDVVLICRSGNRSGRVAAALTSMGFKGLMNLSGGMLAWNAASLPIVR